MEMNGIYEAMSQFATGFFNKPVSLEGKVVSIQRLSQEEGTIIVSYRTSIEFNGGVELPTNSYNDFPLCYREMRMDSKITLS